MGELIFSAVAATYSYPEANESAVSGVDLAVHAGDLVALVGPNGSGKTTLLRLLLGNLRADSGGVAIRGKPVEEWGRGELARLIGVVPQREEPAFPLRVRQAVTLGRYPHVGMLSRLRDADLRAVEFALEQCDITHLADRWIETLSGGEWQRVRVARALAQDPLALVLDEPTASLDVRHEMEVFELVTELTGGCGIAGLLVTHNVNLAARFATRIVVMDRGRAVAAGRPSEVMQPGLLEQIFGWPVDLFRWRDTPQFVPLRKGQRTNSKSD